MPTEEDEKKSGVVSIAPPSIYPSSETLGHQIIDAASALTIDVDFLVSAPAGDERVASASDARRSIDRIVKLAAMMRSAGEGASRGHALKKRRVGG